MADDPDLHRALGLIVTGWTGLEFVSGTMLFAALGGTDESIVRVIVAGQRIQNLWDTTGEILRTFGKDAAPTLVIFKQWRGIADGYRVKRNEAIHSPWAIRESDNQPAAIDVFSRKASQGIRTDLFPGGVDDLLELAQDINTCTDGGQHLRARIQGIVAMRAAEGDRGRQERKPGDL